MRVTATFGILLCLSCASAPDIMRPPLDFPVPEEWRAGVADWGEARQEWWMEFGGARLVDAVSAVLERNHGLRAAAIPRSPR